LADKLPVLGHLAQQAAHFVDTWRLAARLGCHAVAHQVDNIGTAGPTAPTQLAFNTYVNIEQAQATSNPTTDKLIKLAELFDVKMSDLWKERKLDF
jgi:transcriptional regulator with XRE-family HTH domain